MPNQSPDKLPVTLSESIYPQPTTNAGRIQSYSRTPIELPPLANEGAVTSTPWHNLILTSGFAALTMSSVDWIIGIWGGSDQGSLSLAIIGPFALMAIIAGLSCAFYRTTTGLLNQAGILYARSIVWSTILLILPITQGLRWLIMPELLTRTMPIFSHGIIYILTTVALWVGVICLITHLLMRPTMPEQRRHRTVALIVMAPYLIAIPLGVITLVETINLFP